jgi:Zn-dependent peptidase ImmA (M78 family)
MGMDYAIVYENSTLNRQTLGYIDLWENRITIGAEACEVQQKQTLVHEILHAFDMKMGIVDQVSEEQNAMRSNILFEWLRDPANRPALAWITNDGPVRKGAR